MLIQKRTRSGLKQLIALHTQSFLKLMLTTLNMISSIRMERVWEFYENCKVFLFEFILTSKK